MESSTDNNESVSGKRTAPENRFRTISNDLRRYIEKQTELVLLEVVDRVSLLMTRSLHKLMGLVFILVAYVFLMVALALYIGPLLGHVSYGYLVVAGLTAILGSTLVAILPRGFVRRVQAGWVNLVFEAISRNRSQQTETKDRPPTASSKESTRK